MELYIILFLSHQMTQQSKYPPTLSWSHSFGSKAFENFRPISNQVSIGDYRQPICSSSQMLRFLSSLWSEPLQNQLVASRIKNRDSEVTLLITCEFLTTQVHFQLYDLDSLIHYHISFQACIQGVQFIVSPTTKFTSFSVFACPGTASYCCWFVITSSLLLLFFASCFLIYLFSPWDHAQNKTCYLPKIKGLFVEQGYLC